MIIYRLTYIGCNIVINALLMKPFQAYAMNAILRRDGFPIRWYPVKEIT